MIASPLAIDLRIRLMILPERVLGRPGAKIISSHSAMLPISFLIILLITLTSSTSSATPSSDLSTTYAKIPSPLSECGLPTTATSATLSCFVIAASTSAVPIRCPETFITSSVRPVIVM